MTAKKAIAKIMGWDVMPSNRIWDFRDKDRRTFSLHHMECAKLLQQRMVDDGWRIVITAYTTGMFEALAVRLTAHNGISGNQVENYHMSDTVATEPAAIVALFCRVYGIEEGA